MLKLSEAVDALEKERDSLRFLCGGIIATLTLERNQEHMPPKLIELAKGWRDRFKQVTNDHRTTPGYDIAVRESDQ